MQMVIDIDDNEYLGIKNYPDNITSYPVTIHLYEAVRNGTPLPKGHGRLIDADELEECKEIMNTISGESKYAVRMDDIRNMSTIIEADTQRWEKHNGVQNT